MILRSKYLLVNPETIIENGMLKITGEHIKHVGKFNSSDIRGDRITDLGEAVLMPGLVNPHCHLEGPELYGGQPPNGEKRLLPPQSFTDWAENVIAIRLRMKPDDFRKATEHGYQFLVKNGVTMVGDHSHINRTKAAHDHAPIRRVVFEEITDLNPLTAQQSFTGVVNKVKKIKRNNYLMTGVAPHAPYTVSDKLYKLLFNFAQKQNMPLSTHLSELREERELLMKGTGKIRTYLKKVGRDNYYWQPPGTTSVQFLAKLGILKPPSFLVHCNYLSNEDIKLLSRSGVSVVFCPNSHHYFGHRNHPFRKLMRMGVNIALGTDGLGSNEDLSILKEMKFITDNYPGVSPTQLFRMATINGLKTLGITRPNGSSSGRKNKIGELKPGFYADLTAFPLKHNITQPERIKRFIIETLPKSILTMVGGKIVYRS